MEGAELVDSYVFNPHKWMFTNFDCSLFYTRDKETLIRTFEIMPEYLKTQHDQVVNNYRDWGIQLGRRFRALKLWFVLRSFGLDGIKQRFRKHIELAKYFAEEIKQRDHFELLAPVPLNLVCFRFNPGQLEEEEINRLNEEIERRINDSGQAYITHTKIAGKYTLRACIGQTNVEQRHVEALIDQLVEVAGELSKE
jgi:aromatic-L-amino-acid decarboxylase